MFLFFSCCIGGIVLFFIGYDYVVIIIGFLILILGCIDNDYCMVVLCCMVDWLILKCVWFLL